MSGGNDCTKRDRPCYVYSVSYICRKAVSLRIANVVDLDDYAYCLGCDDCGKHKEEELFWGSFNLIQNEENQI